MKCEQARLELSIALDGETTSAPADQIEAHLRGCASCTHFDMRLRQLRTGLRLESLETVPDVAPSVIAAITDAGPPRRAARAQRLLAAAAVFLVSALAGAAVSVLTDGDGRVASADLAERVVSAQGAVGSLDARLVVVERNWHPDVPERRFAGRLVYEAPERLSFTLQDHTAYPSDAWVPNDATLVVDESTRWTRGPRDCPASAQPLCTPRQPRVHLITGREPFDEAAPIPLELVTPVDSFLGSGTTPVLGEDQVAGRPALQVRVTAAQVADLIRALRPAGNLRQVHPSDEVDLWLDKQLMTPLRLRVVASDDTDRRRWAAAQGYSDTAGDVVLEVRVDRAEFNASAPAGSFPSAPEGAVTLDAGFLSGDTAAALRPQRLPEGFNPHSAGIVRSTDGPEVSVSSWSNGRAWLKVAATREWPGGRLFGDLGLLVRQVPLTGSGVAYQVEDGSKVAIHADGVDVVVTGSLPSSTLRAVAAGLGIVGREVPHDWQEAGTGTLDDAEAALGAVFVPSGLEGFGPPAVSVDGSRIALGFAGPGDRGFVLVQSRGDLLAPPLDPDVSAVELREGTARWSPARGELEWVERGFVLSLRSRTMALGELLAIAESLEAR